MPRKRESNSLTHGLAAALGVIGDWWTLLILREILRGSVRFEHINKRLGVARNIQTNRLNKLVDRGVLEKIKYTDKPERFEYRLTESGRDLYGVIIVMKDWGDRWVLDGKPTPLILHEPCGHPVNPRVVCGHCGKTLEFDHTHDGDAADDGDDTSGRGGTA